MGYANWDNHSDSADLSSTRCFRDTHTAAAQWTARFGAPIWIKTEKRKTHWDHTHTRTHTHTHTTVCLGEGGCGRVTTHTQNICLCMREWESVCVCSWFRQYSVRAQHCPIWCVRALAHARCAHSDSAVKRNKHSTAGQRISSKNRIHVHPLPLLPSVATQRSEHGG